MGDCGAIVPRVLVSVSDGWEGPSRRGHVMEGDSVKIGLVGKRMNGKQGQMVGDDGHPRRLSLAGGKDEASKVIRKAGTSREWLDDAFLGAFAIGTAPMVLTSTFFFWRQTTNA